jgi:hypothetical protein
VFTGGRRVWALLCIASILLFPVGLWLVLEGVVRIMGYVINGRRNLVRRSWQTTTGEIISADVRDLVLSLAPSFTIAIRYQYAVDGRTYIGKRIRDGRITGYRREMERLIECMYPVRQTVTVHFNPRRPRRSLLELPYYAPDDLMRLGLRGMFYLAIGLVLSVGVTCFWLYLFASTFSPD